MIFLDPDLNSQSPHGQGPVHGEPDPAAKTDSPRRSVARARKDKATIKKESEIDLPTARTLARYLKKAQEAVGLKGQVTVLLTTDEAMRGLNRRFRGKNKATDVLSFPAEGPARGSGAERMAGDLAVSVTTALRQANEQGHTLWIEIKVLILHGLLHLAGYDHEVDEGAMARRELKLRAKLKLPQGLIERAGSASGAKAQNSTDRANVRSEARTLRSGVRVPQGLKPRSRLGAGSARLKSSPDTKPAGGEDWAGGVPQGLKPRGPLGVHAAGLKSGPFKAKPKAVKQ
jgi:probable rRNA maturation factor